MNSKEAIYARKATPWRIMGFEGIGGIGGSGRIGRPERSLTLW